MSFDTAFVKFDLAGPRSVRETLSLTLSSCVTTQANEVSTLLIRFLFEEKHVRCGDTISTQRGEEHITLAK